MKQLLVSEPDEVNLQNLDPIEAATTEIELVDLGKIWVKLNPDQINIPKQG